MTGRRIPALAEDAGDRTAGRGRVRADGGVSGDRVRGQPAVRRGGAGRLRHRPCASSRRCSCRPSRWASPSRRSPDRTSARGKADRVYATFRTAMLLVGSVMTVMALLCHIAPAAMIGLFSSDPEVVAVGDEFLRIVVVELHRVRRDLRLGEHVPGDGQCDAVAHRVVRPARSWSRSPRSCCRGFRASSSVDLVSVGRGDRAADGARAAAPPQRVPQAVELRGFSRPGSGSRGDTGGLRLHSGREPRERD